MLVAEVESGVGLFRMRIPWLARRSASRPRRALEAIKQSKEEVGDKVGDNARKMADQTQIYLPVEFRSNRKNNHGTLSYQLLQKVVGLKLHVLATCKLGVCDLRNFHRVNEVSKTQGLCRRVYNRVSRPVSVCCYQAQPSLWL